MKFIPGKEVLKAAFLKYLPIGATAFFIGLIWNFPYEKAAGRLTDRWMRSTGLDIEAETLSPALPIGLKATKAHILGSPDIDLNFDTLRVTLSPLSVFTYLFSRTFTLSFSATQDETKWKGHAGIGKEDVSFSVDGKTWKLNQTIPLDSYDPMLVGTTFKIQGTINLNAQLDGKTLALQRKDLSAAAGSLKADASATLELPFIKEIHLDKVTAEWTMEKGKLTLKSITLGGPDLTGTVGGHVTFSPFFRNSPVDLDGKLTLLPKMREKIEAFRTILESRLNLKISPQGTMAFKMTGPIGSPTVRGY